ncbi:rhodanese-like domain-containing protein [Thiohalorhabdus methylotrophus]|uniref:Rhodanese-like domain-containing protein n=1 Tax=Thiohalorhabdus methylotrophus TaxID=3242694 RepID=A0ABV4TST6_9GAMM
MSEEGSRIPDEDPQAILDRAHERAQEAGKEYQGELTPEEAYAILEKLPNAQLVDVRTRPERDFVGYPTLGTHVEWETYPGMEYNPDFPGQLQNEVGTDTSQVLVFMCRSGARSGKAAEAMTSQGYAHCYNLIQGFEGDKDEQGHRGRKGGWQAAGLPWEQK